MQLTLKQLQDHLNNNLDTKDELQEMLTERAKNPYAHGDYGCYDTIYSYIAMLEQDESIKLNFSTLELQQECDYSWLILTYQEIKPNISKSIVIDWNNPLNLDGTLDELLQSIVDEHNKIDNLFN